MLNQLETIQFTFSPSWLARIEHNFDQAYVATRSESGAWIITNNETGAAIFFEEERLKREKQGHYQIFQQAENYNCKKKELIVIFENGEPLGIAGYYLKRPNAKTIPQKLLLSNSEE